MFMAVGSASDWNFPLRKPPADSRQDLDIHVIVIVFLRGGEVVVVTPDGQPAGDKGGAQVVAPVVEGDVDVPLRQGYPDAVLPHFAGPHVARLLRLPGRAHI